METFLSIVGSVASVLGAILAWVGAAKAVRSANAAERVRQEIVDRRVIAEVAQIYSETKRVLRVVAAVGPTLTAQLARGLNCADIAREVETFTAMLLERSNNFSCPYSNRATKLHDALEPEIEGLAEAKTFADKKKYGKSIYYKIKRFAPMIKELMDAKREQTNQEL